MSSNLDYFAKFQVSTSEREHKFKSVSVRNKHAKKTYQRAKLKN
jgi:hypothetical protein